MDQATQLLADGLDDRARAMAQYPASPAGKKVEIAVPLGVPNIGTLAMRQSNRIAAVVRDDVLLEQL